MARRKSLKKNEYITFPNCRDRSADVKGKWQEVFANDHPITLELGCGKAALSLGLAAKYPNQNYVGIDLKMDRMWYAARQAMEQNLDNLQFLCIDLREITHYFAPAEVANIWITFPDPFPKKRQVKHRMVNPEFMAGYRQILAPAGSIFYKTDNLELFHYSLETFVAIPDLHLQYLTFNLHEAEDVPEDWKITTTYERAFLEMGKSINLVQLRFLS